MKLIHVGSLELVTFTEADLPRYAILSHTWETTGEMTYQEMLKPTPDTYSKSGYKKIIEACLLALRDHYEFIWIDTCCINKESSAELSEAINSMYAWYANAEKCYVHLSDVHDELHSGVMSRCRWFTRGWTLQELIAPKVVEFYDSTWSCIGTKDELASTLAESTGIPSRVLNGNIPIGSYSVAMRMSWAAKRQTTRVEDMSYCLLGLFDVNMPLLYGEGQKAFRRLQEEIIKRSNDMSIFVWEEELGSPKQRFTGLLAPSCACFADTGNKDFPKDSGLDFAITNKGLRIAGEVELKILNIDGNDAVPSGKTYALCLDYAYAEYRPLAICLHKVVPGLFCRNGSVDIIRHIESDMSSLYVTDCYIILDPPISITDTFHKARKDALRISKSLNAKSESPTWALTQVVPDNRWDVASQSFLAVPRTREDREIVVLMDFVGMATWENVNLTILCDLRDEVPKAILMKKEDGELETRLMRHQKYKERGFHWVDLEGQAPELCSRLSHLQLTVHRQQYRIDASFKLQRAWIAQTTQWHLVISTETVGGRTLRNLLF